MKKKGAISIVVIVLVIVAVIALFAFAFTGKSITKPYKNCADSDDDNKNDDAPSDESLDVKGTVVDEKGKEYTDSCIPEGEDNTLLIKEYYCKGDQWKGITEECAPGRCFDGACANR